jgi:hypothetical protein
MDVAEEPGEDPVGDVPALRNGGIEIKPFAAIPKLYGLVRVEVAGVKDRIINDQCRQDEEDDAEKVGALHRSKIIKAIVLRLK